MHRQAPESRSDWHPIWKKYHETWLWPDFRYCLWNDNDNLLLVERFFPKYLEVFNKFPLNIYRIDFARNLFLKKWGGVYADMDFVCYTPFYGFLDGGKPTLVESLSTSDEIIQNSMMASPPDHPFWDAVAENSIQFFYENEDRIMANRDEDIADMVKGCTGPFNLTKTFEQVGGVKVLPKEKFNPRPLPQDKSGIYCYHYQTGQWGSGPGWDLDEETGLPKTRKQSNA